MIETVTDEPDGHLIGMTEPARQLHQRVQHDLQIEGRTTDDLEHVSGGSLLREQMSVR